MRYKLTAAVAGHLLLDAPSLSHEHDGVLYELTAGSDGRVATASASCTVPAEKLHKFRSTMSPAPPGGEVKFQVNVGGDRELSEVLVTALQNLESSLGHTTDGPALVRHIRWDEPEYEFIAETDEDRALIGIFSIKYSTPSSQRQSFRIGATGFRNSVQAASLYAPLQYTASLHREAEARFSDGQYLDALTYNFLALEDLFADGHTGKKQTIAAFTANPLCRKVIGHALESFNGVHPAFRAVRAMFGEQQMEWTVDGAIAFLYSMRGQLLHAATRRRRFKEVLARQAEFRPLALFLGHIVGHALLLRKVQIVRAAEGLPPEE